jgi:hypothetical protein
MDTRFWGPSGWKLLHLIAQDPIRTPQHARRVLEWFSLLEYVLPCKYCRASFHDYIRQQPLTLEIVMDSTRFSRWVYDIHNRVNAKLRGQGLLTTPDPEWGSVSAEYQRLYEGLCDKSPLLGWDFMTSIAYTTPTADYKPIPMADMPEEWTGSEKARLDVSVRNRYNLLTYRERLIPLRRWWELYPSILPCAGWRRAWTHAASSPPPLQKGRDAVLRWMWRVEEAVCSSLQCATPHDSLPSLQKEMSAFESGCSLVRNGKTCRSRKMRLRRTLRRRRTRVVV